MSGYTNYSGVFLPASAPYTSQLWATGTDPLYGPNTPTQLMGSNEGNFLQGGSADDTIYVINTGDTISGGGGIDTAIATVDFTLPGDVENLAMNARWSPVLGVGNAAANILTAQTANVTLIGAGGDDVIVSAGGGDTFVFAPGSGRDTLINFVPGSDVVRLQGYGFSSFAQVQSAMTQVGADTLLRLSSNDLILFKNTSAAAFSAHDFQVSVNTAALTPTFDDEFNTLALQRQGQAGGWATAYDWAGYNTLSAHTITNESEVYVDPTFAGSGASALGLNPFSVNNGVLTITAAQTPAADQAALWNEPYTSGLITTSGTFAQTYGYFEMRAEIPAGQGTFPAFWLLPQDGSYSGEIDVMENVNGGDQVWNHIHYVPSPGSAQLSQGFETSVPNLTTGFHTFGVLWTPQTITWYIDGAAVSSTATPAVMNKPMYMLADYAVGGSWAGAPDPNAIAATSMQIDYIRAYSLDNSPVAAPTTLSPPPVVSPPPVISPPPPPAAPADTLAVSSGSSAVEGDAGITYETFTVTRAGDLSGPATVNWSVAGSGANPADANDFQGGVPPSGEVFFGGGESSKTIWVPIHGDTTAEADEGFTLSLSNPTGAAIATGSGTGVILNDDGGSVISPPPAADPGSASSAAAGVFALSPANVGQVITNYLEGADHFSFQTGAGGFQLANQAGPGSANVVEAFDPWAHINGADVVIWDGDPSAADSAAKVDGLLVALPGNFAGGVLVAAYTPDHHVGIYYDPDANSYGPATLVATISNLTSTASLNVSDFLFS